MNIDEEIKLQQEKCDKLRLLAHDAPLAQIGERHTGERHILYHTNAWADASNKWIEACNILEKLKAQK